MGFDNVLPTVESATVTQASIYLGGTTRLQNHITTKSSRRFFSRDESIEPAKIINSMVQAHSIKIQKYDALFWSLQLTAILLQVS